MKSNTKIVLMVGGFLCAAGVLLSGVALGLGGFRLNAFSVGEAAVEKSYDLTQEVAAGLLNVVLDMEEQPVEVAVSADDAIHIRYWEDDRDSYTITQENGELHLLHKRQPEYFSWFTDGLFSGFTELGRRVVLELPAAYAGNLQIKTSNASIHMESFRTLADCSLQTTNGSIQAEGIGAADFVAGTSNSSLTIKELTAVNAQFSSTNGFVLAESVNLDGEMAVKTTNGSLTLRDTACASLTANTTNASIRLEGVTAAGAVQAGTTNGDIRLEALASPDIRLTSTNGPVRGTVAGDIRDYAISSRTTNGSNNLPDTAAYDLPNHLDVSTTNDSIAIEFIY